MKEPQEPNLNELLSAYSFEDLVRSFFVLNLWLPNVGSPIKLEYLYAILEGIGGTLPKDKSICSYAEFVELCRRLIAALPNLSMLEDYLPESDWGEIKYYFNKRAYRIFYGASLSNPYEFYSAFEVCHLGYEDDYQKLIHRSPSREFEFCLAVQDDILKGIDQTDVLRDKAGPGFLEVPGEAFWNDACAYLDRFKDGTHYDSAILAFFSYEMRPGVTSEIPDLDAVLTRSVIGKNAPYFFLKYEDCYYPVMPRKYLSVLCDTWGTLMREHYEQIRKSNKYADGTMELQLARYVIERMPNEDVFGLVTAMESQSKPHELTFAAAIHFEGQLCLIHLVPPSELISGLDAYLEKLIVRVARAKELLCNQPTRLGVWVDNKIAEFRSNGAARALEPTFLVTMPYLSTEIQSCTFPKGLNAIIIPIDQLLGMIDEAEDTEEIVEFFKFRAKLLSETAVFPMTSHLDLFGAYRDSHSVLLEGAEVPTHMYFDPQWGTVYRYQSLALFWSIVPEVSFIGHPRSWRIPKNGPPKAILSKRFRAYAHFETVGEITFFLNCPVQQLTREEGTLTELVLHAIRDGLTLYAEQIQKLRFTLERQTIQIFCAPSSAAMRSEQLTHLRKLVPRNSLWAATATRIRHDDVGISFVFDNKGLTEALLGATDRSIQIDMLAAALQELQELWPDERFGAFLGELHGERSKLNRFRLYEQSRDVTFPQYATNVLPGPTEYKLADRDIAGLASSLNIEPKEYEGSEANDVLNKLKAAIVASINDSVSNFNVQQAIPVLLSGIDTLVHNHEVHNIQVRESMEQEVEYDRPSALSQDKGTFLHDHQVHRHLVEKFVQLAPTGSEILTEMALKLLLAKVERLLNLYAASDAVHYGIVPARLSINHEFIATIQYEEESKERQRLFGIEKAQMQLGLSGNLNDIPELPGPIEDYLNAVDSAMRADLGFGVRNLANVLQIMSLWAVYRKVPETTVFSASAEDIIEVCLSHIRSIDRAAIRNVVEFLTLKADEVIAVEGHSVPEPDIPVWEYIKRRARYTVKPLILLDATYYWGPYSTVKASYLWMDVPYLHKLPITMHAPKLVAVLLSGHRSLEKALATKVSEIAKRFCANVQPSMFPHQYDQSIQNIGDCDTFVYLENQGIVLNIESKVIDPPRCYKDARRLRHSIFGRLNSDNVWEDGYLQKVEKRHKYLVGSSATIVAALGWGKPVIPPRVVSIFVTQVEFWWTRFPPVITEVTFVESRMLDDFLQKLL